MSNITAQVLQECVCMSAVGKKAKGDHQLIPTIKIQLLKTVAYIQKSWMGYQVLMNWMVALEAQGICED